MQLAHIDSPKPLPASSTAFDGSVHLFDMDRRLQWASFRTVQPRSSKSSLRIKMMSFSRQQEILSFPGTQELLQKKKNAVMFSGDNVVVQAFVITNNGTGLVTACRDGLLWVYYVRVPNGEVVPFNA